MLRKHNLVIIGGSLVLLLAIIFSLYISFSFNSNHIITNAQNKTKLPCVVIDPGHGGEDGGAVADDNTLEKDINLEIALNLKEFLIVAGYPVVMTRDGDYSIYDESAGDSIKSKKVSDMKKRLTLYNENTNNIVISIHQNKFTESKYSGAQVFYSPNNKESSLLADSMQQSIKGFLQPDNNRETKSANKSIYLLWNSSSPAVIIECGFLSNSEELARLKSDDYRKKMAYTIFCGFLDYVNKNAGSDNGGL